MKHRIALITLCYNESKLMPFVLDYWKKFVTHAYVFDNGSTDDSREILSQHDWITVIDYSHLTGNKLDDNVNMYIKNNFWKTIKYNYDWVVVCDFDECLWCADWENILDVLNMYKIPCIVPNYYNMITKNFPEYVPDKLFHEVNDYYINVTVDEQEDRYNKMLIFNTSNVYELNLDPGSHKCKPITLKNNEIEQATILKISDISCFHLVDVGLDYIIQKRKHNKEERMTEQQIKNKFAVHYLQNEDEITSDFNEKWNNKKKLIKQYG